MRLIYRISLFLCLAVAPAAHAADNTIATANNSSITTWWPDPRSGLMWTGDDFNRHDAGFGLNYAQAVEKCSSLSVNGFTGWRLPTSDELNPVLSTETRTTTHRFGPDTDDILPRLIWFNPTDRGVLWLWTSTPAKNGEYISVHFVGRAQLKSSQTSDRIYHDAVCVRPMDPDLQQLAKMPLLQHPVSSIDELKAVVPLVLAQNAYHTGDYNGCISNAKQALQIDSTSGLAYFGIGVCEGALGQFDQATADLATAKKLIGIACDHNVCNVGDAQSWVKKFQKASKKKKSLDPRKYPLPTWVDLVITGSAS